MVHPFAIKSLQFGRVMWGMDARKYAGKGWSAIRGKARRPGASTDYKFYMKITKYIILYVFYNHVLHRKFSISARFDEWLHRNPLAIEYPPDVWKDTTSYCSHNEKWLVNFYRSSRASDRFYTNKRMRFLTLLLVFAFSFFPLYLYSKSGYAF